jgi:hypothetical protein
VQMPRIAVAIFTVYLRADPQFRCVDQNDHTSEQRNS